MDRRRRAGTVHPPPHPQSLLDPPVRSGTLYALSGAAVSAGDIGISGHSGLYGQRHRYEPVCVCVPSHPGWYVSGQACPHGMRLLELHSDVSPPGTALEHDPGCGKKGSRGNRSIPSAHLCDTADGHCCGSLRYLCFCKTPVGGLSLPSHHVCVLRLRATAPSVPGGIPGHDGAVCLFRLLYIGKHGGKL